MFGLSPLGLFFLAVLALLAIGPQRLPDGLEAVFLALTNFQNQQRGLPPLDLDTARVMWRRQDSTIYKGILLLRAVTDHLVELRQRLIRSLIAFLIGTLICVIFFNQFFAILTRPIANLKVPIPPGAPTTVNETFVLTRDLFTQAQLTIPGSIAGSMNPTVTITASLVLPKGTVLAVEAPIQQPSIRPVFTQPTEMFVTSFKIAFLGGFALALPFILLEVALFILPALEYPHERRWLYFLMPSAFIFFVVGAAFAYFLVLPQALGFLLTFGGGLAQALPSISSYVGFVVALIFWIGLSFETPLAIFFLAKIRVVTVSRLVSGIRVAIVAAFVIAALITPTPDPFNQTLVALPIILLYLLGILFARFA
jgi:sec-independent protein translocase protein TatC